MSASGVISVFVRLSGLMAEGRKILIRHSMWFGVPDQIILLASTRVRMFDTRMHSLVERWRAGKLKPRKPAKRGDKPKPVVDPNEPVTKPLRLPNGFGWLSKRIRPDGFGTAEQLKALIAEPEMVALMADTHLAGRLLRPICHMYGVKIDSLMLPKRERKPRPVSEAEAERRALRAEAAEFRALGKTSSKKSPVPPGHTFPTTRQGWAIWVRRSKRHERKRKAWKFKSA